MGDLRPAATPELHEVLAAIDTVSVCARGDQPLQDSAAAATDIQHALSGQSERFHKPSTIALLPGAVA